MARRRKRGASGAGARSGKRGPGRAASGRGSAGQGPPPLRLVRCSRARVASLARRSRVDARRATTRLLRLEDREAHGNAFFTLEGERWRWPRYGPPRLQRRRLNVAAPQAFTATLAIANTQKARVKGRRPSDNKTIK